MVNQSQLLEKLDNVLTWNTAPGNRLQLIDEVYNGVAVRTEPSCPMYPEWIDNCGKAELLSLEHAKGAALKNAQGLLVPLRLILVMLRLNWMDTSGIRNRQEKNAVSREPMKSRIEFLPRRIFNTRLSLSSYKFPWKCS